MSTHCTKVRGSTIVGTDFAHTSTRPSVRTHQGRHPARSGRARGARRTVAHRRVLQNTLGLSDLGSSLHVGSPAWPCVYHLFPHAVSSQATRRPAPSPRQQVAGKPENQLPFLRSFAPSRTALTQGDHWALTTHRTVGALRAGWALLWRAPHGPRTEVWI